jgi:ATP-dependent Lon protease
MLLSGRGRLLVTGNLIRAAKDSAQVAVSLARSRARRLGIDPADFLRTDVHFHVPGEATKDGPSAGLALFLALVSAMIRKPLDPATALIGEISLSGKIHDPGGTAEKIAAGRRAGVKRIFLPGEGGKKAKLPKTAGGPEIIRAEHVDAVLERILPAASPRRSR